MIMRMRTHTFEFHLKVPHKVRVGGEGGEIRCCFWPKDTISPGFRSLLVTSGHCTAVHTAPLFYHGSTHPRNKEFATLFPTTRKEILNSVHFASCFGHHRSMWHQQLGVGAHGQVRAVTQLDAPHTSRSRGCSGFLDPSFNAPHDLSFTPLSRCLFLHPCCQELFMLVLVLVLVMVLLPRRSALTSPVSKTPVRRRTRLATRVLDPS